MNKSSAKFATQTTFGIAVGIAIAIGIIAIGFAISSIGVGWAIAYWILVGIGCLWALIYILDSA